MGRKPTLASITFMMVWAVMTVIIGDEELGLNHIWGFLPITVESENNLFLFLSILAAGPTFTAWWMVHVYRRKYGDLKDKQ